jgi:hypothetical protein
MVGGIPKAERSVQAEWGRGRALRDARRVEGVDVCGVEEFRDYGRHAAEVSDDVLLGGHYHDAAVWLLRRHCGQVGSRQQI